MKYNHILEVNAKEWFDKSAGNSYFSATILLDDINIADLPFQYGYGDHYLDMAMQEIKKLMLHGDKALQKAFKANGGALWSFCDNNKVKLVSHKQENCLKRELN